MSLWLSRITARFTQNQPALVTSRPALASTPYVSRAYPLLTLVSPPRWNKKKTTKPASLISKKKQQTRREEEESSLAPLVLLAVPPPLAPGPVTFRPPHLGTQDEQGNLPLLLTAPAQQHQVSSIPLVAVAATNKEQQEHQGEQQDKEEDFKEDGDLLVQLAQTKGTHCRASHSNYSKCDHDEDDTLSTAGSSVTECTNNTTSGRFLDTPPRSARTNKEQIQLGSIEQQQLNVSSSSSDSSTSIDSSTNRSSTTPNEEEQQDDQMRAMLVMKDVIFRQRSAIKKLSKENKDLHKKYDFYKLQNETLSRANKQMKREVNQVRKKNEELELELRNLLGRTTAEAATSLNFANKVEILQH